MSTEELALLISVVSAVISLCAVYFARKTFEANILVSRNTALVAQTETNEQRLHDFPKLLKLYGIEETSLRNDKVRVAFNKYIYRRLMSDSPYMKEVKRYLDNNP